MACTKKVSIAAALREGVTQLTDSDAPQLDAEYLLLHALGTKERSWLYAHGDDMVPYKIYEKYAALLHERQRGVPLAYVLGTAEFYGRAFGVTPEVLVPRPATEELVHKALTVIEDLHARQRQPLTIADVGCGSGCIAITLALETAPTVVGSILATDISPAALNVARANAQRHGVESRLTFLHGDMLEPIRDRALDLIVSNPPYVPTAEIMAAHTFPLPHTRGLAFEPQLALNGGVDGMKYVTLLRAAGSPLVLETTQGSIRAYGI